MRSSFEVRAKLDVANMEIPDGYPTNRFARSPPDFRTLLDAYRPSARVPNVVETWVPISVALENVIAAGVAPASSSTSRKMSPVLPTAALRTANVAESLGTTGSTRVQA
jgi:hypothetical protein